MTDVGHKLAAADFRLLQGGGHVVELGGQLVHLHGAALVDLGTGPEVAVAEAVSRFGQIFQLLGFIFGQYRRGGQGHQQHHTGGNQENLEHGTHQLGRFLGGGGNHHKANALTGRAGHHRRGHIISGAVV